MAPIRRSHTSLAPDAWRGVRLPTFDAYRSDPDHPGAGLVHLGGCRSRPDTSAAAAAAAAAAADAPVGSISLGELDAATTGVCRICRAEVAVPMIEACSQPPETDRSHVVVFAAPVGATDIVARSVLGWLAEAPAPGAFVSSVSVPSVVVDALEKLPAVADRKVVTYVAEPWSPRAVEAGRLLEGFVQVWAGPELSYGALVTFTWAANRDLVAAVVSAAMGRFRELAFELRSTPRCELAGMAAAAVLLGTGSEAGTPTELETWRSVTGDAIDAVAALDDATVDELSVSAAAVSRALRPPASPTDLFDLLGALAV